MHVPELLYVIAIVLVFITGSFLGSLLIVLLTCRLTRQIADFIRGEKSKRKNEEVD